MAEYEAGFLRISRYAQGMVVPEHDKCVKFENRLLYDLIVQVPYIK